MAKEEQDLYSTAELGEALTVSDSWVRKHLIYTEWHHCYLKYGDDARAYFYKLDDVARQVATNPALAQRLRTLQARHQREDRWGTATLTVDTLLARDAEVAAAAGA